MFREHFAERPESVFLRLENQTSYTFAQLELKSGQFARLFGLHKLKRGDRILVQAERNYEVVALYVACLRYGVIFVPISPLNGSGEIAHVLHDAKPSLIVCQAQSESFFRELMLAENHAHHIFTLGENGTLAQKGRYLWPHLEINEVKPSDIACILYTSGTTGKQKGVMLSHQNLALGTQTLSKLWRFEEKDILLLALSFSHGYGLTAFNVALYSGSRIIMLVTANIDNILQLLPQSTVFMGTPTHYQRLCLSEKSNSVLLKNTRLFISGTAPLSEKTFSDFLQCTGKKIVDRYGMTETIVNTSNEIGNERAGSCGKAIPGVEIRIMDDDGKTLTSNQIGNIEVRSPYVFQGYWHDPKNTREVLRPGGFFRTGDIGHVDNEGYVWLAGRSKDVAIINNRKIYMREIESYIEGIEGIEGSAVFSVLHPQFGICLIAVVQVGQNSLHLTPEGILRKLRNLVAHYKIPKGIVLDYQLPRTPTGKVQKQVLQERYGDYFTQNPSAP